MNNHVQFGDNFAFSDIRAAVVMDDGSIVRTLNGVPMTAGTSLFLRTPLEQAAPMLLEALMECRRVMLVEDSLNTAYGWADHVAKHVDPAIAAAIGENA